MGDFYLIKLKLSQIWSIVMSKVINLVELQQYSVSWKKDKKKIILCHGCFDPLHAGHIDYFKQAKTLGDILVVSITNDTFLNLQKGDGRPFQKIEKRLEILSEISCINYLIENQQDTVEGIIEILKPDIYAKGAMNQLSNPKLDKEILVLKKYGEVVYLKLTAGISSSKIISNEAFQFREYIKNLPFTAQDMQHCLDKIKKLKVLVIGETILDKYTYVKCVDKAPKTSILATQYLSEETFTGASAFITNIIAGFVDDITFITYIGNDWSKHYFKNVMAKNVKTIAYECKDRPTICKHRFQEADFIELPHRNTLFELCNLDDKPLPEKIKEDLLGYLAENKQTYDMIIVSDFGHGLIDNAIADMLCYNEFNNKPFITVMVQSNESNYGFNTLRKYPAYNYLCTNEIELRLEYNDKHGDIESIINQEWERSACNYMSITSGSKGAYVVDINGNDLIPICPVDKIVDRIGAGDAFLALSALYAKLDVDRRMFGLAGIVSSSMKVETVSTKQPIQKQAFINKIGEVFAHV